MKTFSSLKNYLNYCLSGWIENLGVVPLFLSAAFLFLPIFLSFILLLHLVCIVLDAIILSLSNKFFITNKFRQVVLYSFLFIVKGFIAPCALSTEPPSSGNHQLFLARGEQEELKIKDLGNFSVGNPQVLAVKYRSKQKQLLLKGKSIGFSDLIIWHRDKKITYKVFVISKKEQLKRLSIIDGLRKIGLNGELHSGIIFVSGNISNLAQYLHVKKLKRERPEIIWHICIDQKLRNEIIADIYATLYGKNISFINCEQLELAFNCYYQGTMNNFHRSYLESKYLINFLPTQNSKDQNFFLEFKIIQIEHYQNKAISTGLEKISSSIGDLIKFNDFIQGQTITLEGQKINATLLANPKSIITMKTPVTISLGAEVPFSQTSNNGVNTQWKFAGLKIKSDLQREESKLLLNYQTDFTRPVGDLISGSTGKGAVYLKQNDFVRVFEITFETTQKNHSYLPGIGEIPFLKYLFQGTTSSNGHKQIIGFVKISKGDQ
jgi:hypothetical protein